MSTTLAPRRSFAAGRPAAILGGVLFAAAVAAASQIAVPLPWTPVPITLQPMLVIMAGMMLGPVAGAASMVLYLAAGAAGLPVFTPIGAPGIARFFGPTGGYLLAYPVAAYVAGALALRMPALRGRWLAGVAGIAVIYLGGIAVLSMLEASVTRAVLLGVSPFAALDIVKAFVAAAISVPLGASGAGAARGAD
ncbi:MAG TPA: biotin transporter BioY [Gemmatimonadaceae bacterium]|jgi:biotin transport system substrate-specific component|nr:biotin transporter BioY [Gemmatimonadaceae bacterium]